MSRTDGLTLVELLLCVSLLSLLLCFGLPLYRQHEVVTRQKLFEKELTTLLTTARLQAFVLQKTLRLEPFHFSPTEGWQKGIRLREDKGVSVLHEWTWPATHPLVVWSGFRSNSSIVIDAYPEKLAMNGYFQVGKHRLVVNRFGRIRAEYTNDLSKCLD